jgi:multidrug efflux pump subunit AcrA (membrane-fusion protein)
MLVGILSLAITVQAGCRPDSGARVVTPAPSEPPTTPGPTSTPGAGVVVLAEGQLVAVNPVLPLAFEVSGRLLEVSVQPGAAVAAGDIIARLDDASLRESVGSAELQVAIATNSLAQSQAALDELLGWEIDELALSQAEANLVAAQASYDNAISHDAAAGNSVTSARIGVEQAQRSLADAQEAYDKAHDQARDWELNDPFRSEMLRAERDATARNLEFAQENLEVAQAQLNLAYAGINNDSALQAQAGVLSAEQALEQARTGPTEGEITRAELQVEQAELSLQQSQLSLQQAEATLARALLVAPWEGRVLAVDTAPGAIVGAGTPIVTLLDTTNLQFHTTNLSERDLGAIEPGLPVVITLKAYPLEPLSGEVVAVGPQAVGALGDAALFTVMVQLEPSALELRPGMTGRAEIAGP